MGRGPSKYAMHHTQEYPSSWGACLGSAQSYSGTSATRHPLILPTLGSSCPVLKVHDILPSSFLGLEDIQTHLEWRS